jgi:hypothetical protein
MSHFKSIAYLYRTHVVTYKSIIGIKSSHKHLLTLYNQGRIYSCGGPGVIEMWRRLSVITNLGYIAIIYK